MAQRAGSVALRWGRSALESNAFALSRAHAAMPQPVREPEHEKDGKVLHPDLLNSAVKKAEYAVRGELYLRAVELQKQGMKIVFTNGTTAGGGGPWRGVAAWVVSGVDPRTAPAKRPRCRSACHG